MMTCRTVRDALPEYAAGRPVAAREQIAEHLSRCAACAAVERELRAVFGALSAAPQPAASDGGERRALRALRLAADEAVAGDPRRGDLPQRVRRWQAKALPPLWRLLYRRPSDVAPFAQGVSHGHLYPTAAGVDPLGRLRRSAAAAGDGPRSAE